RAVARLDHLRVEAGRGAARQAARREGDVLWRAAGHRGRDGGGPAGALIDADAARVGADREVVGRGASTGRELERADPGTPVEGAIGGDVLVRVPERTVVRGIDGHRGVVSPPREASGLRS